MPTCGICDRRDLLGERQSLAVPGTLHQKVCQSVSVTHTYFLLDLLDALSLGMLPGFDLVQSFRPILLHGLVETFIACDAEMKEHLVNSIEEARLGTSCRPFGFGSNSLFVFVLSHLLCPLCKLHDMPLTIKTSFNFTRPPTPHLWQRIVWEAIKYIPVTEQAVGKSKSRPILTCLLRYIIRRYFSL